MAGSLSGRRLEKKDEQKITYVLGPFHVGYPPLELIRAVAGRRSNFADIITQGVGIHHERPFFVIKMNRCCRSSGRFARASLGGRTVRGRSACRFGTQCATPPKVEGTGFAERLNNCPVVRKRWI